MASHSSNLVESILKYTWIAANALQDVAGVTQIPFLVSVCSLSASLVPLIQNTKFQRERCLRMLECVHKSLCALLAITTMSEHARSPKLLDQIAQYAQTLQRFYSCLKAQENAGKLKRLFKKSEITAQLASCEAELASSSYIFTMQHGVGVSSALAELDIDTDRRHQELLELISTQSASIDEASSLRESFFSSSSGSLSLLPASPKIFHGRNSELNNIVSILLGDTARVAILGPGGVGKTTLSVAALHVPAVMERYSHRHFVSCESVNTGVDLVLIIGSHLGLEPSRQLSGDIIRHLTKAGPSLLLLDNLETPWEPLESRGGVEEFLSLLADVPHLALLVTMRGAERPAKVKWTKPFLPVLEPLSSSNARQMFAEIADEPGLEDESALDELLDLSGGLPLAISLLANIASFEGYAGTLARWKIENTALLSDGHDKRSNLEKSIVLSLGSPRISSSLPAKDLLSLLSLLPDGIIDEDLVASKVPIPHVAHWRSLLVRTSLAYVDGTGRLKALSPIREYIRRVHPPSSSIHRTLCRHFQGLLDMWDSHQLLSPGDLVPRLASYIGNINELMLQSLLHAPKPPTEQETLSANITIGHSIMKLNLFSRIMLKGNSPLMKILPDLIDSTGDSRLRWAYVCQYLRGLCPPVVDADAERFIGQGVEYFSTVQCPIAEAVKFYNATAFHYRTRNLQKSNSFNGLALSMINFTTDSVHILESLDTKVRIAHRENNTKKLLEAVSEAQTPGRITSAEEELNWLSHEAIAIANTGDYSRALGLIGQVNEQLVAAGLMGSDKHLGVIDLQGAIHLEKQEYIEARKFYAVVISKTSPNHSPLYHAHALAYIAYIDILTEGSDAEIVRNLSAAEAVYAALGNPQESPCSWITSELYMYRGDLENARSGFEQCVFTSPYKRLVIHSSATLADPRHKMHDRSHTFCWAVVYLCLVLTSKDRAGTFQALRRLADIFVLFDEEDTALNLYDATLEGATEMDIHCLRAECMAGIADIMFRRGDSVQAKEMWEAAHTLFIRSSQMKDAAAVRARIDELQSAERVNQEPLSILNGGSASEFVSDNTDGDTDKCGAMDKLSILSAPLGLPPVENDVPPQSTTEHDSPGTQDDGSTEISVTV